MMPRFRSAGFLAAFAALALLATAPVHAQAPQLSAAQLTRIDSVFARWDLPSSAGCALGVSYRDQIVLERAWGMAELEHGIPITPATIFEAGSVSKQFTTAAILLLALEGKLSLDDDIRRHVPEVPDYGTPITLRHLITHTSGLKDWGSVAGLGGWPRGSRAYTHAHVLEIIARQRTLNHPPGEQYIYSNSNYNLLAIIAERVSGESLPVLTKRLLFDPLGMTSSGWRDDFQRLVPGRAQAYARGPQEWRLVMPNESVYGNSSLLTTVGDLLRWSANTAHGRVGGEPFRQRQQTRGVLTSGDTIAYAGGIMVGSYRGMAELSHGGATAGYRAFLARYPDTGWSVALLCNTADAIPGRLARDVADVVHGLAAREAAQPTPAPAPAARTLTSDEAAAYVGRYRSDEADVTVEIALREGQLVLRIPPEEVVPLTPLAGDRFRAGGPVLAVSRDASGRVTGFGVSVERARNVRFERVAPASR